MNSGWTAMVVTLVGLIGRILSVPAVDVQQVQLGLKVTLSCNVSYVHQTTWFKHNPGLLPTVVLCALLSGGQPVQVFQLSPRYSVSVTRRSLGLTIADVDDGDLGLYYCIAKESSSRVLVGGGVALQGSPGSGLPVESSRFHFHHWYCVAVGSALLVMVATVCCIHFNVTPKRTRTTQCCCSTS